MQDPLDVLLKIRGVAGNGMFSYAERLDKVEALVAEGRALLAPAAKPEPAPEPKAKKKASE